MSWGFKSNINLDNNKYLTLFDPTNITKINIIGLDTNSNLNINSASGDIFLNCNNSGSETFINFNNTKNVLVSSKLAVGISNTSNINANLTLVNNGFIGINTTQNSNDSYLGLAGSSSLSNTTGSRILLFGNDNTNGNNGNLNLYAGNSSSGSINLFTGNDSNTFQILKTGTSNFSPNGSTIRVSISDTNTLFTHQVQFTNTNTSTSATTGSVLVNGGLGIVGDTFISGTLNINSAVGNINFANSTDSTNYSTGALALFGGLAIRTSTLAVSADNGGGLSVAGGFGLGGNAIFNSTLEVFSGITTSTILSTGLTTGNIQSTGLTTGDINFTGILYQNSIPYVSSQWTSTNGNIFYGSTGSIYVGIGTTNPTFNLDVNGSARISTGLTTGNIQSTGLTTGDINFTGALYQNSIPYVGSQWTGTNGNNLFYGSTGSIYVGIGTTNPTFNLDVNGSARISTGLSTGTILSTGLTTGNIQSTGLTTGDINITGALYQNSIPYVGSQWTGTNGNNLFYGSTGSIYVGIGTTNPTFNLDVNGSARISTGLSTGTILSTGLTTGNIQSTGLTTGDINFTGTLYQNSIPYVGSQWTGTNGNNLFYGSTGSIYVGIGTTNPTFNLDVNGSARISTGLTTGNIQSTGLTTGNIQSTGITTGDINFTGTLYQNSIPYIGSQWTSTNGNLFYGSTGSTFVGIGTTNPTNTLTVNGSLSVSGNTTLANVFYTNFSTGSFYTNTLSVNNSSYVFAGSCSAGNNINTATNLLGLILPTATTRSFSVIISVSTVVSSGPNYFTQYTVEGIQTDAGWIIDDYFIGDIPNITFTITSTGQLQYTSNLVVNWTSTTLRYQATCIFLNTSSPLPNIPTSGNFNLNGQLIVSDATNSVNTSVGSIQTAGGIGITKNLTVGGGATFGGHLIPSTNITQDIGSSSNRWRDIYLSGNTIDLGGTLISAINGGTAIAFGSTIFTTTTVGNIGSSISNLSSDSITSGTINVSIGITSAALLVTGMITASSIQATSSTIPNIVNTNISTGTINASTGITSAALLVTGMITASSIQATSSTIGSGLFTNLTVTNFVTNTISTSSLYAPLATINNIVSSNLSSGTVSATSSTIGSCVFTNLSSGTISATSSTIGSGLFTNLTVLNLLISTLSTGSIYTPNSTISNLVSNSISSGTLNVTSITSVNVISTFAKFGTSSVQSGSDVNDCIYLENTGGNYTQLHMYQTYSSSGNQNAYISINKPTFTNGFGNTIGSLNIWSLSNTPILFGINGSQKLAIDSTGISTENISSTNLLTTNLTVSNFNSTNISTSTLNTTNLNVNSTISSNVLNSSIISVGNLYCVNQTLSNIVNSNITSSSAAITNIFATTSTISNSILTNITSSNILSSFNNISNNTLDTYIRFENTNNTNNSLIYHVGSTAVGSSGGNGFSIFDFTNTSLRFLIGSSGNVGINTNSPGYTLDINGTIARSGVRLPRFDNGTFSGSSAAVIPILFSDTTYNYVEVKVSYQVSTISNVVLTGNTASNGAGSVPTLSENSEIRTNWNAGTGGNVRTTSAYISENTEALGITANFNIKITRGIANGSSGSGRNHYIFDTIYCFSGSGTAHVNGMGRINTDNTQSVNQLRSILMTPSAGTISGTWNTQHFY